MKRIHPLVLSFFSFCTILLSSFCSLPEVNIRSMLSTNNKQLIFISSKDKYMLENEYYDALIELKEQYPKATQQMIVIETGTKDYREINKPFSRIQAPAIVIIEKGEFKLHINGPNMKKNDIVKAVNLHSSEVDSVLR